MDQNPGPVKSTLDLAAPAKGTPNDKGKDPKIATQTEISGGIRGDSGSSAHTTTKSNQGVVAAQ